MTPLHAFKVAVGAWWFLAQVTGGAVDGSTAAYGPYPSAQFCQQAQGSMDELKLPNNTIISCPCYHIVHPCTEIDGWEKE